MPFQWNIQINLNPQSPPRVTFSPNPLPAAVRDQIFWTNNDTDQPTVITGPGSNGALASVWVLYTNHVVDPTSGFDRQNMAVHGAAVNGPGVANVGTFSAVQLVSDVPGVAHWCCAYGTALQSPSCP